MMPAGDRTSYQAGLRTCAYFNIGKPITAPSTGPRKREYCHNACKERAYRERKATPAQPTPEQQTIAALQEKLSAADAHISKLELDNRRLRAFIDQVRDIEEAFRTDNRFHHGFKKFLTRSYYYRERPGCAKILDKANGFPPGGSRGSYGDAMRRAGFTADEQADVWDAWRDMLKSELFRLYYQNREGKDV